MVWIAAAASSAARRSEIADMKSVLRESTPRRTLKPSGWVIGVVSSIVLVGSNAGISGAFGAFAASKSAMARERSTSFIIGSPLYCVLPMRTRSARKALLRSASAAFSSAAAARSCCSLRILACSSKVWFISEPPPIPLARARSMAACWRCCWRSSSAACSSIACTGDGGVGSCCARASEAKRLASACSAAIRALSSASRIRSASARA